MLNIKQALVGIENKNETLNYRTLLFFFEFTVLSLRFHFYFFRFFKQKIKLFYENKKKILLNSYL